MSRMSAAAAILGAITVLGPQATTAVYTQGGRPTPSSALLRPARQAIGNEAHLHELKSLVMQGTTRGGFNGVTAKLLEPQPIVPRPPARRFPSNLQLRRDPAIRGIRGSRVARQAQAPQAGCASPLLTWRR